MLDRYLSTLLFAVTQTVDRLLYRGAAISAAFAKRGGRIVTHMHFSSYDERCTVCMPDTVDEIIKSVEEF